MTPVSEAGTSVESGGRLTFDLAASTDMPTDAHAKAGRRLYNVIDWSGSHRGQIALTPEEHRSVPLIQFSTVPTGEAADAIKWAEALIRQLPETHDGRNSWLLNHGKGPHDWPTPKPPGYQRRGAALQTPSKTVGAAVTHRIRAKAFSDIMRFQPDSSTGVDAYEQIAIHARSTIIEAQKQIAAIAGAPNA